MLVDVAQSELTRNLAAAGIDTAALDARLMLGAVLQIDDVALMRGDKSALNKAERAQLARWQDMRLAGCPLSRILGRREFYGLSFALSPDVLDPRPESELLVDHALALYGKRECRFLDLGTGSGCLAIAICANAPRAHGTACDISARALDVARANAEDIGVANRLCFVRSDWWQNISGARAYDFIVANPPYIASDEIETLARDVRLYDPLRALDGGADGLCAYRAILARAAEYLCAGGHIFLEIGAAHAPTAPTAPIVEATQALFAPIFAAGGFAPPVLHRDLAGLPRLLVAKRALH